MTAPAPTPAERITAKEAAEMLGVHPNTVWNYVDHGWLKVTRLPSGTRRLVRSSVEHLATTLTSVS